MYFKYITYNLPQQEIYLLTGNIHLPLTGIPPCISCVSCSSHSSNDLEAKLEAATVTEVPATNCHLSAASSLADAVSQLERRLTLESSEPRGKELESLMHSLKPDMFRVLCRS